ncbi:MAG: protein-disulfide reductase DsbD N-terminal domain-containing protein [Bacteroidetes bacterium]|nr:protein-disulfide reductase DsbD N-terminal domain-containing protein [Bacteroidota bacterium]
MRFSLTFVFICSVFLAFSQDKVVSWRSGYDQETKQINIYANIQEGWHLYAQAVDPMAGPIPTSFTFKVQGNAKLFATVAEPEPIKAFDENFESEVLYFEKEVKFSQKVLYEAPSTIEYTVNFMVCNDVMCLPPIDEILEIRLN